MGVISCASLADGDATWFFDLGNLERAEFHQSVHALLAETEIEERRKHFLVCRRDVERVIEEAFLDPVIAEQGV